MHYLNKAGPTREGEALFWRRARFSCRAAQPLAMRQLFAQLQAAAPDSALAARHAELLPMLRRSPALCRSLAKASAAGPAARPWGLCRDTACSGVDSTKTDGLGSHYEVCMGCMYEGRAVESLQAAQQLEKSR